MRGKEDLFRLVKAMSRSEKRYFTIDAQKGGKKGARYLQLFRALSDMDEYDENALKKGSKNFSADKGYLYDAILRSMRDYRSPKSKAAQIKEKILDSKYLFERGLYLQCNNRLEEARALAGELGDELLILEVIRERLHTIKSNKEKNLAQTIADLLEAENIALANVNQFFTYSDKYYEIIVDVSQRFRSSSDEERMALEKELTAFFEKEEQIEKSRQAERRFLQSKALYYQMLGDTDKVLEYFKKVADWWEENPGMREEEFYRYMRDVSNLLYAYHAAEEVPSMKKVLAEFKQNQPTTSNDERVWAEILYHYELLVLLQEKNNKPDLDLIAAIDEGIKKYHLEYNMVLRVNMGLLYFSMEEYEKSADWLTRLTEQRNVVIRKDVHILARLINMVNFYEQDEIEALENFTRSTLRYLKKEGITKEMIEGQTFNTLNEIFKADYQEARQKKQAFSTVLQEQVAKKENFFAEPLLFWIKKTTNLVGV